MKNIHFYIKDDINHNNWYTKFKYIFMAPIALLRFTGLICVYNFSYIVVYFPNMYEKLVYVYCRVLLFLCGFLLITFKNKHLLENAINNKAIFVYNHTSIIDSFVISLLTPLAITINHIHGKYIKHIIDASSGLIIKRGENQIFNQTQKIIDHVKGNKRCLLIAPEGTVTNGKYLLPFKVGAFVPLHAIQPVLLIYKYKYLNLFFSEDHPCIVIYRMLTQFINYVSVELLPLEFPLPNETPLEFATRVRSIMADALHVQKV